MVIDNTLRQQNGPDINANDNIIAVASGKGGVGKTWFSITLSHAFALRNSRVLLFDADLGLANVDIQLGLMPQRDIGGVIAGKLTMDQAKTRYEDGKFDVLAGHSGSGNLAALPPNQLLNLGEDLVKFSKNYDRVIMDLGAGIDRTVRNLSSKASTIIVIANTEPTSLTDAYAFIKLSVQTNPSADIRLVINNCASHIEGQRTYETLKKACESFLKFTPPFLGSIRRDSRVIEAIRSQIPLLTRHPMTNAAEDTIVILDRLLNTP
ncbi:MinD/ParA family protein [Rhodospirillaceae bacterium]|jgi:flagellar biosynthesis protein FlhG|nr:MinD/ParA family protein [Rhodospirillaceae bacterium]|tara:strand:+ start:323 stop:1117 length:795 start_codon:yes stop_codon:yes gene_type:complete